MLKGFWADLGLKIFKVVGLLYILNMHSGILKNSGVHDSIDLTENSSQISWQTTVAFYSLLLENQLLRLTPFAKM